MVFVMLPLIVHSEGSKKSDNIIQKVKIEGLSSLDKFWAEMYNDNRVLYSICVTGLMMFLGIIIGFGAEIILRLFGFRTTKMEQIE
jgi:ABC-type spermidine/putrescine transport system permease subunit II